MDTVIEFFTNLLDELVDAWTGGWTIVGDEWREGRTRWICVPAAAVLVTLLMPVLLAWVLIANCSGPLVRRIRKQEGSMAWRISRSVFGYWVIIAGLVLLTQVVLFRHDLQGARIVPVWTHKEVQVIRPEPKMAYFDDNGGEHILTWAHLWAIGQVNKQRPVRAVELHDVKVELGTISQVNELSNGWYQLVDRSGRVTVLGLCPTGPQGLYPEFSKDDHFQVFSYVVYADATLHDCSAFTGAVYDRGAKW